MIDIRPLTSFDPARFAELASGYTSPARYVVHREEAGGSITFRIELETLPEPFTKHWTYEEEHDRYAALIPGQGLSLGAYDGDRLVGVAICERQDWNRSLWLWEFHLDPQVRGQGIGRRLMEGVIAMAAAAGLRVIVAETQNTNVPAIRFYRRMGFTLDGIDLSYYDDSDEVAFFMKRFV